VLINYIFALYWFYDKQYLLLKLLILLTYYKTALKKISFWNIWLFVSLIRYALSVTLNLYLYFFILLFLFDFLFSMGASIQSRFRWSTLRSDLLTVINELFRWFSYFYRLFFPSRHTSYSSVRLFLLHALVSRQSFRSPTPSPHFSTADRFRLP